MATVNLKPMFQPRVLRTYAKWAVGQVHKIIAIQRWWRAIQHLRPTNTVDCITLEAVEKPVFLHISDQRHVTAFSALPLAQYIATSGNFTHPQFRTPFDSVELWRLDKCTGHQFNLLQNRDLIQTETAYARNENSLTEFLMNDVLVHIQAATEVCLQQCTRAAWGFQMRMVTEQLTMSLITLATHNVVSAAQVLTQAIQRIENQPGLLLNNVGTEITFYMDVCERCMQFSFLLKFIQSDMNL